MKRRLFVVVILITTLSSCFPQQYYVGAAIGWHQDIFTLSETNKYIHPNNTIDLYTSPIANLNFSFLFKNNMELTLGLGYYKYKFYRFVDHSLKEMKQYKMILSCDMHSTLSVPFAVGYNINLWKNRLLFKIQSGLDFDIYFSEIDYESWGQSAGSVAWWIYLSENTRIPHFNILVSNRLVLQYYTKFNMSIALFGAYHAGLIPVWQNISGHFEWKSAEDPIEWQKDSRANLIWNQGSELFDTKINSNGSYWQFGIELGYRFGKKRDKQKGTSKNSTF